MKISLIQIGSGEDKEINFNKALYYIREAVKLNSDIICLPENFLYSGKKDIENAEDLSSSYIKTFQELALKEKINLILGSLSIKNSSGKISNTSLVIDRNGKIVFSYNKIYMYDVEREDLIYHESENTEPGKSVGFFELEGIKMGVGICVDLRYPEYFRELIKLGAEIIFLPSSFRKITGELAWKILSEARAIENQIYFCACSQTGGKEMRERCGNSRIISFDGTIISEIKEEEGIVFGEIDFNKLKKYRKEFPVLRQIK